MITGRRAGRCRVVELPVAGAVEEALPLVAVEDEDPLVRVADTRSRTHSAGTEGEAAAAGAAAGCGAPGERDLDRAVALAGALPGLGRQVDAELGDRGLGGHGFLATPQ